jgi:Holliday junction resolvasome RuvABC ATP-dependent DNA helicase subunit
VAQELQRLAEKEIKRRQFNRLADNLKELQEQNTARSIEQQSLSEIGLPDADQSMLKELAQINEQIAGADTLEKTLFLKEHIALFKK